MIAKQYKLAGRFIRERVGKLWLILLVIYIAIFLAVSLITAHMDSDTVIRILYNFDLLGDDDFDTTWYNYLIHNGRGDLLSVLLGLIPFVPVPILVMLFNIFTWGATAGVGALLMDISVFRMIGFAMLPHCVFELPANCLSDAMGLLLFAAVTGKIRKKTNEPLKPLFINCLRVFVLIVLPLLLVAGIIEAEITPLISARLL